MNWPFLEKIKITSFVCCSARTERLIKQVNNILTEAFLAPKYDLFRCNKAPSGATLIEMSVNIKTEVHYFCNNKHSVRRS